MKSRNLFTIIAMVIMVISFNHSANSQVIISLVFGDKLNSEKLKFGLDGGAVFSNISNLEGTKYYTGFNLGFYFDFMLKENTPWYLHTGVLVKSPMGARDLDTYSLNDPELDSIFMGGRVDRQLRYFNVPIMIRYVFKNHLFLEVGPNLGLLNKAHDIVYNEISEKDDVSYEINIRDQYKLLDAGMMAGLGYSIMKGNGMNFGIRYYYGLMDIIKDNPSDPQRNSSIYLFASIPIGAGEKAQAKKEEKKQEKEEKKLQKEQEKN